MAIAQDGGDLLRLYYTGNVKEPGEHDFVYEGRGRTRSSWRARTA